MVVVFTKVVFTKVVVVVVVEVVVVLTGANSTTGNNAKRATIWNNMLEFVASK